MFHRNEKDSKEAKLFTQMCLDFECKENMTRPITRKVCKNNCKHYNNKNKKCLRGYNYVRKTKNKRNS